MLAYTILTMLEFSVSLIMIDILQGFEYATAIQ